MSGRARVNEVPARRGLAWMREAFDLFRQAPATWIGLCAGWIAIWLVLLALPLAGPILQTIFFAGFAIAAWKQSVGERVTMGDLFAGFRRHAFSLFSVGFLSMLAQVASALYMRALGLPSWPEGEELDLVAYAEMLRPHMWILASGFALLGLISGALWFAPQLIVFQGLKPSHAVRWSVYAAASNVGAMLVYGLALCAAFIASWLTLGLGLIVLVPVIAISTYTGYRDVFERPSGD